MMRESCPRSFRGAREALLSQKVAAQNQRQQGI
jgi:hypothetical protein